MERSIEEVEEIGPIEWKEEFYEFKRLPRL
jgi:hypothetical protein